MGILDPKLGKDRAFELLRKKGAIRAVCSYNGGNDEGGVDQITLFFPPTAEDEEPIQDLEVWYCGGYTYTADGTYQPASTARTEDQELSEILQGPVDEKYGTWAGDFSAYGTLTWDVATGEVVMDDYCQADYDYERHVY